MSFPVCAEKAFDEKRNLKQPKELSINKVGHGKITSCTTCNDCIFCFQVLFLFGLIHLFLGIQGIQIVRGLIFWRNVWLIISRRNFRSDQYSLIQDQALYLMYPHEVAKNLDYRKFFIFGKNLDYREKKNKKMNYFR